MITDYFFDLYGNLLQTTSSEELVEVGQNIIRPAPIMEKGMMVELEIDDKLQIGIITDVTYFPPRANGDRTTHISLYDLKPKHHSSARKVIK